MPPRTTPDPSAIVTRTAVGIPSSEYSVPVAISAAAYPSKGMSVSPPYMIVSPFEAATRGVKFKEESLEFKDERLKFKDERVLMSSAYERRGIA